MDIGRFSVQRGAGEILVHDIELSSVNVYMLGLWEALVALVTGLKALWRKKLAVARMALSENDRVSPVLN